MLSEATRTRTEKLSIHSFDGIYMVVPLAKFDDSLVRRLIIRRRILGKSRKYVETS